MKTRFALAALLDAVASGTDRHYAAIELVTAMGTAIGATIAALAAAPGDSLAIKHAPGEKPIRLLQFWTDAQVVGTARIRSGKFHDNVQGIRFATLVGNPRPLNPWGVWQRLYPNDVLNVELAGSAVAGDIESVCMLLCYDELPGSQGDFMMHDEVKRRVRNIFTVENTLATGTAGGYSGGEAINVEFDQFKAGSKYALLGYTVNVECAAVGWRGANTSNLRIGGPGAATEQELTANWFLRLSQEYGLPTVPVFAAENKSGILVDAVQDENGLDVIVTSIFAELS